MDDGRHTRTWSDGRRSVTLVYTREEGTRWLYSDGSAEIDMKALPESVSGRIWYDLLHDRYEVR